MSAPATTNYPITKSSEKVNAFWGCRECKAGGSGTNARPASTKHRRETNHEVYGEFHEKWNYPSIDVSKILKSVPVPPKAKVKKTGRSKIDVVTAEDKVHATTAPDGLTHNDLMILLSITWSQASGLRHRWLEQGTFRVERHAGSWRVFP